MFRFWYRFVFPNMSSIVSGLSERLYDNEVSPYLNDYMGLTFEEICKQYFFVLMKKDKLPFFTGRVGRWRGNDPVNKCEAEIDVMAYRKNKEAIFAECKWTNARVDLKILNHLIEKSKIFNYKDNYYYLFSKSGFKESVIEFAKSNENVKLFSFEEMNKI